MRDAANTFVETSAGYIPNLSIMKPTLFCLLSAGLILAACETTPIDPIDPPKAPIAPANSISLRTPVEGQMNQYVRYEMGTCEDAGQSTLWTSDTLVVEVQKENGQFYLVESLTPGSPIFLQGGFPEPVKYPITSTGDYALVPERDQSILFFFYGNDTIHLRPNHDVELKQVNCGLTIADTPFIGNEIGFVPKFKLGELLQEEKTVVSCVPVVLNLEAYLFYEEGYLFMSHTIDWAGNVTGWQMLSD